MNLGNILKGHVNELLNLNEELFKSRMEICNKCPIMEKKIIGKVCSTSIYINTETNDVVNTNNVIKELAKSISLDKNYKHGCGCRLDAKTRDLDSSCPIGKW